MKYRIMSTSQLNLMKIELLTDGKIFYVTRSTGSRVYFLFSSKQFEAASDFYLRAINYN
jgi:hypothetical protein